VGSHTVDAPTAVCDGIVRCQHIKELEGTTETAWVRVCHQRTVPDYCARCNRHCTGNNRLR
jgi:hypothetical protein